MSTILLLKGVPSHEQTWIPFTQKFEWHEASGSGEEVENVKCLQTDGQTDDERHEIRKANELPAHVS